VTYDIVGLGDVWYDTFIEFAHGDVRAETRGRYLRLPLGSKLNLESAQHMVAGPTANTAVGFTRLGYATAVVTEVGRDTISHRALAVLEHEGVDTRFAHRSPSGSVDFAVVINYHGERTILTRHEAHRYFLPPDLATRWMYLASFGREPVGFYNRVAAFVRRKGIHVAFNPGSIEVQLGQRTLASLLAATSILFVNREEAAAFVGLRPTAPVPRLLQALTGHRLCPHVVVVTDGRRGAYAASGGAAWAVPIFPGPRVEATGAGDAFACAFTGALMAGENIPTALAWGAVNSASVVQYVGGQRGLLARSVLRRRLEHRPSFHATRLRHARPT
jgi:sugar/nucleoside kinase (ribokinase family)